MLSVKKEFKGEFWEYYLYLEFCNFNCEKQNILSSPQRVNQLSQLLRPQWIKKIRDLEDSPNNQQLQVSFTGNYLAVFCGRSYILVYRVNPDLTIHDGFDFYFQTEIESISLICSTKLLVKSKGSYFEFNKNYQDIPIGGGLVTKHLGDINQNFTKTNIKNVIQCGIYDLLIYEKHVKIFNNINPLNELKEIAVGDDIIQLLISQKFIQLDDNKIVCLPQPLNPESNRIQIIDIYEDKLVRRESFFIQLKSPWDEVIPSDCKFDLLKFKEYEYLALIVTSPHQQGQFYQFYSANETFLSLSCQKSQNGFINLLQIPHLPLVTSNGQLFINCEINNNSNKLDLDIMQDECEILNQDQVNLSPQSLEIYDSNFKKSLFAFIEAQSSMSNNGIQTMEIPELNTSVSIRQDGVQSAIIIFSPSLKSIKHLILKQPMNYITHKVIYRDSSYYVSIILSTNQKAFYEVSMSFDLSGVTLAPFKFIMKLKEAQNLNRNYLSADLTLSLLISDSQDLTHLSFCCFRKNSLNQKSDCWSELGETLKLNIKNTQIQATASQMYQIIQRVAQGQSIMIEESFLRDLSYLNLFSSIQNLTIKVNGHTYVFAFQNKFIILFQQMQDHLVLIDDKMTVISRVYLKQQNYVMSIASIKDSAVLEYIDILNNKFPFPIMINSQDSESQCNFIQKYTKNFRYPMPFMFGLHDGLISHLDFNINKLLFYMSEQDRTDGNILARIEIIAQSQSFIDDIIDSIERKDIDNLMNNIDMNLLLSFNTHKRMNLITGTKTHKEIDYIYSVLYKKLESADIRKLPMLIYNTSLVSNRYETILDVLIENKAIQLAQLILNISLKQDKIGYLYNRLGPYVSIFGANEIQLFIDSPNFFFKISKDYYEEYQVLEETLIWPNSDYDNFDQIQKNMKVIEKQMLPIEEVAKNQSLPVPIEYYAINLKQLMKSQELPFQENHRDVTKTLSQLVETDSTILERVSIQSIIDFKWNSYAQMFFSVQLFFFICFIIAFIIDIVAVSRNSNVFSSEDINQVIPRIISISIIIPFAIYEVANIMIDFQKQIKNFWNIIDLLLVFVCATYFTISFAKPEQDYILKSLQLIIVVFSFIKFSFLIRIWTKVSFLVRMLIVVFKELLIFLLFFLLVIGGLTVMAQIIIKESGDQYDGIKLAAFFVIVLRQSIGDYDTSSIVEGTKDFQILAWLLWLLILIIGNIVFMNFIIAVVSESYEKCMEQKIKLIYSAKFEMIEECEDLMPEWIFTKRNWFPRFIIIRGPQGCGAGGDNPDEWQGFIKQIKRHIETQNNKLFKGINQQIKDTTTRLMEKDTQEIQVLKEQMVEIKQILSVVYKDQIAAINVKEIQANYNKAN